MTGSDGIARILAVLDARVQLLEARLGMEMRLKQELRSKQMAIASQEQELMSTLQDRSVKHPASFRFGELRLRKLVEDQNRLQPVLVKAAIQRGRVQEELKANLRKKLALELQAERRAEDELQPFSAAQEDQILFEMKKRP